MAVKKSKYNNKTVKFDDYTFDSLRELARYKELKALEIDGLICDLVVHPIIKLKAKYESGREVTYEADFGYTDLRVMEYVFEDVKGVETDVFKLKRALVKYFHNIEIQIVK